MSRKKTVKEAIEFLSNNITSPMAGMIADMLVEELFKQLSKEVLNQELESPE